MDKPTSIPQECVPESVIERAAAAFARHDHEQVEWERIPEEDRDYYRRVALDMLTAAQQQGGGGCSHEAWEENGGWRTCVDCGHGWSARTAPPSAPVGVKVLARDVHYAIRDAGLAPEAPAADAAMRNAILAVLAQQPAAVDEAMTQRIMSEFHANDPGDVWPPDEQGRLRRKALQDAINNALATQHQEPTT